MTVKISLKNVSKSFGSKNVLNNVNLDVEKGKSLVILGGSGSGKSVMLKLILGIIKTDSGQIIVDGDDALKYNAKQRNQFLEKFGMLFQGGALFDSLPVWQNICFALIQSNKLTKKDAVDYAVELLRKVGLGADVALLSPAELSGGMQKRVSLARAIARKPDIIFFDEPTTGLSWQMLLII
jgi:phospholipid/cholesterol/gamma-HCH transport system ATP-binding protein